MNGSFYHVRAGLHRVDSKQSEMALNYDSKYRLFVHTICLITEELVLEELPTGSLLFERQVLNRIKTQVQRKVK